MLVFAASALAAAAQEVPSFGAKVESVYVDVWVGRGATPVSGLDASSFEVKDDGVVQTVELVDRAQVPLDAVLVLDTSASVAGAPLEALKRAALAFLGGLAPGDRATLLTFSHLRRILGPVAGDPAAVAAALPGVTASGTTALHDAVFTGLKLVASRRGRPVLVVFSDGKDRVSWLGADTVDAAAREAEASIYVVDSAPPSDSLQMSRFTEAGTPDPGAAGLRQHGVDGLAAQGTGVAGNRSRYRTPVLQAHETSVFLRKIAEQTGGRVWNAAGTERLAESFLDVLAHVKSRYLLRYEPTGVARAGWHKLEVSVRDKKAVVRARRGYLVTEARE